MEKDIFTHAYDGGTVTIEYFMHPDNSCSIEFIENSCPGNGKGKEGIKAFLSHLGDRGIKQVFLYAHYNEENYSDEFPRDMAKYDESEIEGITKLVSFYNDLGFSAEDMPSSPGETVWMAQKL